MADKHRSGNPGLVGRHKNIQHKGVREEAATDHAESKTRPPGAAEQHSKAPRKDDQAPPAGAASPGTGKPDKEEGVGTVQRDNK